MRKQGLVERNVSLNMAAGQRPEAREERRHGSL